MSDNAGLIQQSSTIFDWPDTPTTSILELQTTPTQPLPADLSTTTGLLAPDVPTASRLAHFPSDLYDLSDSSHLTRFLRAMLGDTGTGQLRKRQLVARLQTLLNSTHFYDLDAFYGALFGVNRGVTGALPINPYVDTATADGWDEISTIDAQFREKLLALARAITMGGTPLGLQAMAEALTGVDCDVYEVWALLDAQGGSGVGQTWTQVESAYTSWDAIEGTTYNDISGTQSFGNMGQDCRNEVVVRPKKVYDNTPEGQRERADDIRGILRVLEVLKPAHALLSVDTSGVGVHGEATPASITADSNYWEVSARTVPRPELAKFYTAILDSYDSRANPSGIDSAHPQPPFTSAQGQQWSYANEVVSVKSEATRGLYANPQHFDTAKKTSTVEYDTVHFPDGTTRTYLPSYAVIDPKKATAGRISSDGVMVAAPYSGSRAPALTAG
jgi:hypothetical protein